MNPPGYEHIAPLYDILAAGYSGGAIRRAKESHVSLLRPGERVLYAGAGTCSEGLAALNQGATVTLVDESRGMLRRARQRFGRQASRAQFLHQDVFDLVGQAQFDHVVAPFFLNVFAANEVGHRLSLLLPLLRPSGRLTIVDFRAPQSGFFAALQRIYYLPPLWLFGVVARNPRHSLYDYRAIIRRTDLPLREIHAQIHRTGGLGLYESTTFVLDDGRGTPNRHHLP